MNEIIELEQLMEEHLPKKHRMVDPSIRFILQTILASKTYLLEFMEETGKPLQDITVLDLVLASKDGLSPRDGYE